LAAECLRIDHDVGLTLVGLFALLTEVRFDCYVTAATFARAQPVDCFVAHDAREPASQAAGAGVRRE
jgi:hypothetical protein